MDYIKAVVGVMSNKTMKERERLDQLISFSGRHLVIEDVASRVKELKTGRVAVADEEHAKLEEGWHLHILPMEMWIEEEKEDMENFAGGLQTYLEHIGVKFDFAVFVTMRNGCECPEFINHIWYALTGIPVNGSVTVDLWDDSEYQLNISNQKEFLEVRKDIEHFEVYNTNRTIVEFYEVAEKKAYFIPLADISTKYGFTGLYFDFRQEELIRAFNNGLE